MTRQITYLLLCSLVLLSGCKRPAVPDLRETYSYKDSKPFGGMVARRMIGNGFPNNHVQTLKMPFSKNYFYNKDTASIYFCASRNFFATEDDVESLMNFVYRGNTAFIASGYFDSILLNNLYCKVARIPYEAALSVSYMDAKVSLINAISNSADSFGYFYAPFISHFSEVNERYGRTIGYNSLGKPNCIVFWWGKGKLFLHTDPRAFSNYFLLTKQNHLYMQRLMAVMHGSPQHIYWDDYYNKLNRPKSSRNKSSLSELFRHPPLKAAFWLLLGILLLYILIGGKRKQRIIREIKPNENSSVAFTETIARLYLQKHDNKSIADKMITYFNEFIRTNYFLSAAANQEDMITALSRKSGVSEENTAALFKTIDVVNESEEIDDHQLLSLSSQIQQFYKTKHDGRKHL